VEIEAIAARLPGGQIMLSKGQTWLSRISTPAFRA
jgi:hypothetical protein